MAKSKTNIIKLPDEIISLPLNDNTSDALKILRAANERFRQIAWPKPYDVTNHKVIQGDARNLSFVPDNSAHLIVTSPPYWTLKEYPSSKAQLGAVEDYESFLEELDKVWSECRRVLVPGGRICCVVGDVCISRKKFGKHFVVPLHSDIQVRVRSLNLDVLTPIIWSKIANGVTEVRGNGAGFYGKPFQPGAVVKNDIEYILFLRKGGEYRKVEPLQKALSILTKEEMQKWWRSVWTDIPGASRRSGHPAPYPVSLAERLIRMFSFAGDVVLDPFAGTGSTAIAAVKTGRNSVNVEIDSGFIDLAIKNIEKTIEQKRVTGAINAKLVVNGRSTKKAKIA